MAFLDRSQIVRTADRAPSVHGKELMVGILLAALFATLAIRNLVPADALAIVRAALGESHLRQLMLKGQIGG